MKRVSYLFSFTAIPTGIECTKPITTGLKMGQAEASKSHSSKQLKWLQQIAKNTLAHQGFTTKPLTVMNQRSYSTAHHFGSLFFFTRFDSLIGCVPVQWHPEAVSSVPWN